MSYVKGNIYIFAYICIYTHIYLYMYMYIYIYTYLIYLFCLGGLSVTEESHREARGLGFRVFGLGSRV